jgi:hypothetical protein
MIKTRMGFIGEGWNVNLGFNDRIDAWIKELD